MNGGNFDQLEYWRGEDLVRGQTELGVGCWVELPTDKI